jgi:hypothetical protein
MHGGTPVREEAGRLEQRHPGAQAGGDVRDGSGDRGLEAGDRVLRAVQRDEQRVVAAACGTAGRSAACRLPRGGGTGRHPWWASGRVRARLLPETLSP